MCRSALVPGAVVTSSSDSEPDFALFEERSESESGVSPLLSHVLSYDAVELLPDESRVVFRFSLRDDRSGLVLDRFATELRLPLPPAPHSKAVTHAAFSVGCVSLCWLFMGLPCSVVSVRAARLSASQCAFWAATLNETLGEFFQQNNLPFPDGVTFRCDADEAEECESDSPVQPEPPEPSPASPRRVLVPMGGGKDSTLVWELLHSVPDTVTTWLYLEDEPGEFSATWRLSALAAASGCDSSRVLVVTHAWRCPAWEAARSRRFEACGHPWAALVATVSTLVAVSQGYHAIAVGNERSAGEGNGTYLGAIINHQVDKALQWEASWGAYIARHICRDVEYFSALAHLWEVQVAERFWTRAARYAPLILSCNSPVTTSRACAACPKCLFTALLLTATAPHPHDVFCLFGDDVHQNGALRDTLHALLGVDGVDKPLDCVGTRDEAAVCVSLARDAYLRAGVALDALPVLLTGAVADAAAARGGELRDALLSDCGPHRVPHWAQNACGAPGELYVGGDDARG